MWKTTEGSTGRLIQLCLGYFFFYVVTGVTVKYFLGSSTQGLPGMDGMEFLVYSTLGGTAICLSVVLAMGWYRLKSSNGMEYLYIIPSGICTAVVIPTTTLMYTLPISVMVAMVIMRASVIVISRVVDSLQIRQGILHKKVYREEDIAVVFALLAAGANLLWVKKGDFDFLGSAAAVVILGSYILAYALRIYIMNYYKNTRAKGISLDNQGFFGIEQIAATVTLLLVSVVLFFSPQWLGWDVPQINLFVGAITHPQPLWQWAVLSGVAYGMVAFFSVFIFMFKGRTATFAGLVNRLTSLIAGTVSTLVVYLVLKGKFPKVQDWISLAFILTAVAFLSLAERKRTAELAAARELNDERYSRYPVAPGVAGVR
ncbi:MAG: hypothetical protein HY400_05365 [Elusimicrobia bacterium]|nr:hypothetical protein [Elusimicrobiota bacterium]